MYTIIGTTKDYIKYEVTIRKDWGDIVADRIKDSTEIADEYYGTDRDIFNEDGGWCVLIPDEESLKAYEKNVAGIDLTNAIFEDYFDLGNGICELEDICNNETVVYLYMPIEMGKRLYKEI